jgi:1,4-dihydroxy-2-naphthoate octaprenyltransferase
MKVWILAARPKTLWAAVAPVTIGTALAYGDQALHWPSALIALTGALLIQVGTNFCNDYCDFKKGADTPDRQGPVRATQAGLISPDAMKRATVLTFVLAAVICSYLVWRAGWPLALVGALSILCGVLYTAGPFPLAYVGLGDLFVVVFFGPVAAAGTYYVQALHLPMYAVVAGLAPGLLSTAILTVNNLRDIESDRKAGKKTLAVRLGATFARWEYTVCVVTAALVPVVLHRAWNLPRGVLLASLILPIALPVIRRVWRGDDGRALNPMLGATALLLLLYSALFAVGCVV